MFWLTKLLSLAAVCNGILIRDSLSYCALNYLTDSWSCEDAFVTLLTDIGSIGSSVSRLPSRHS